MLLKRDFCTGSFKNKYNPGLFLITVQILYFLLQTSECFTDSDLLFIGPVVGSDGESEVLSLPSLTIAPWCTTPVFPRRDHHGYVGGLSPDGPLLCGGYHGRRFRSSCYLLAKNGSWVPSTQMKEKRHGAAAVQMENGWWVTGTSDSYNKSFLKTKGFICQIKLLYCYLKQENLFTYLIHYLIIVRLELSCTLK